jgi:exodeoxyribonuclease V beta subunit
MSSHGLFDICGTLPRGRVAIEASAGTGKTYTLAGLVLRYVAEEDVRVDRLLIVTFTRAAAAELRDRVRSRLIEAVDALRAGDAPEDDELLAFVAQTDPEGRLGRLERAVVDFDSATITTIHGFAQQFLSTLGSAASGDLDATLLDDTAELLQAVCADVLAAESLAHAEIAAPLPTLKDLSDMATKVLGNPGIRLLPDADDAEVVPAAARLRRLVDRAVEEVHRRRRAAGTVSFDDLLTELRDALYKSPAAAAALRRRFQVVLIDEFQDTDPVQWAIFSELFGLPGDDSTLVMVADPKQAIFAFRGANVHTYLEAAHRAGTERSTLGVNWRSDGALLGALEQAFKGATFGDPRIEFVPVAPSRGHRDLRLETEDGAVLPALWLRLALGDDLPRTNKGRVVTQDAVEAIADDLAEKVRELLDTAWLPAADDGRPRRRIRPSDIAVLVVTHRDAETMQAALRQRDIPAVAIRSDSVLKSPAAKHWRWLLTAVARPNDPTRARTAALSWFFGWSVERLAAAEDEELSRVQVQLAAWSDTLANEGAVEFCSRVWSESAVTARVLGTADGDRNITDLDHIAGLVQAASSDRRPTPDGLLGVLQQPARAPTDDPENDVTARQVESEADAVRLMTIFVAKGLEFPVVCVPTLWRGPSQFRREVMYQDPATGLRTFDIANNTKWPTASEAKQRKALANRETLGENLRLLYVALTRAEHSTLLWWSRTEGSDMTGLAHVLFGREQGKIDANLFSEYRAQLPDDADARGLLQEAFAASGDAVAVSLTIPRHRQTEPWLGRAAPAVAADDLGLAVMGRPPDRSRRRWSFSAISRQAVDDELDPGGETLGDAGAADENADPTERAAIVQAADDGAGSDLPLGEVPGGAQFGTLVHEVLERVDFASVDLEDELRARVEDRLRWNPWPVTAETLVAGLRATIETPLGPLFDGRRLRDLASGERLGELNFELRLGENGRAATDRDIGHLVLGYLREDDPLRPWAQRLASGLFSVELAGHLTGSIDLVARVRGGEDGAPPRDDRFVVIDYKTNVLGALGSLPQAADYRPNLLPAAMAAHHYPLQALLYEVALHRYLRWRIRGYQPARHLGGIAYLFVRGMAGEGTPVMDGTPYGVFGWRVPPQLVSSLSDLLDGAELAP